MTDCEKLKKLIDEAKDPVVKQYLERAYELMGCGGVQTNDSGGGPTTPTPPPSPPPPSDDGPL